MDKIEQALGYLEAEAKVCMGRLQFDNEREARQALATLRAELAGMKADAERLREIMKEFAEAQGDYDMTLEFYSEESNHKEMRRARGRMQKAAKAYRQALAAHDKDSR